MKYIILTATFEGTLVLDINKYLKDGWELYGGPFSTASNHDGQSFNEYGQAMIKKNGNSESPTL